MWRLRAGAPAELRLVIDGQAELRAIEQTHWGYERNNYAKRMNDQSRLARRRPDERAAAQERIAAARAEMDAIDVRLKQIAEHRRPAFNRIAEFNTRGPPRPTGIMEQERRRYRPIEVGSWDFEGATVVKLLDAKTAVVRARQRVLKDHVIHNPQGRDVWVEAIYAIEPLPPFIVAGLPDMAGWKAGDEVALGEYMIVTAPETIDLDGQPLTAVRVRFFTLDAFERVPADAAGR